MINHPCYFLSSKLKAHVRPIRFNFSRYPCLSGNLLEHSQEALFWRNVSLEFGFKVKQLIMKMNRMAHFLSLLCRDFSHALGAQRSS